MTGHLSARESDDNYRGVIARLNDRCRVIVCKDGMQWILQTGKKDRHGTAWRAAGYFRRRDALNRAYAPFAAELDPVAAQTLATLPAIIGQGQ